MKKQTSVKEFEGYPVYQRMMDVLLGAAAPEALETCVHPDFAGYGSAAHEIFRQRDDLMDMARKQMEQYSSQQIEFRRFEPSGKFLSNEDTYLIMEEFSFGIGHDEHTFPLRVTTLLQRFGNKWLVTHMHGSSPDTNIAEDESFPDEGLRKKNAELEAKIKERTRELEIEAALDRARAQSMQMQHSGELSAVSKAFHEQLMLLGIDSAFSFVWLPDEGENSHMFWTTWTEGPAENRVFQSRAVVYPMDKAEPYTAACFADWASGVPVHEHFVPKNDLEAFLASWSAMLEGATHLKPENFPDGIYYTEAFIKYGCFGIDIHRPLSEEEKTILYRFAIEFERAYTRFLDLQKAEAQAREAKIEAALERVRARAMAMHASDELKEVAFELRKQMGSLEIPELETCAIHLYEGSPEYFTSWAASKSISKASDFVLSEIRFPRKGVTALEEILDLYHKKSGDYVVINDHKRLSEFMEILTERSPETYDVVMDTFLSAKESEIQTFWACADFNGGSLLITTTAMPDAQSRELLRRFANVFNLSYQRFSDLKQAEAQAREAQVEAALEKVRSSMMAMHKTEELHQVLSTVMAQLRVLGFPAEAAAIIIINEHLSMEHWMTGYAGDYPESYIVPYVDHPYFTGLLEGWQKALPFKEFFYEGNLKIEFSEWLLENSGFRKMPPEFKQEMLNPSRIVLSEAYNKYGMLEVISPESLPEASQTILKRFSKVFEQAYTRFLDLQKAEAQAREAQIEAALERVRAQAMAMRHSDDLEKSTRIVFDELEKLQLSIGRSGIGIFDRQTRDCQLWTTVINKQGEKELATGITSLTIHPMLIATFEAWLAQAPFSYVLEGNDLKDYYEIVAGGDFHLSEEVIADSASLAREYYHYTPWGGGGLYFFSDSEPTGEDKQIMRRFAEVFDLTYTRFLDLQKAEAQAREAQIEAALERVRSRSMAMHNSEELVEVATVLYSELIKLEPGAFSDVSIVIFDKPKNQQIVWGARTESEFLEKSIMPLLGDQILQELYDKWQSGEAFFTVQVGGVILKNHNDFVFPVAERTALEDRVLENMPDPTYFHCAVFSMGYLELLSDRELAEESESLLIRFATVFDQTYTRFLDLQKAEAQAREAQIEAALERVRSRSMAMHKSEELTSVATVLYNELIKLQVSEFSGASIVLFDEKNNQQTVWGGQTESELLGKAIMPLLGDQVLQEIYDHWHAGKPFFTVKVGGARFKKHKDFVFPPANRTELENRFLEQMPDPTFFNCAAFSMGYLELVADRELKDESASLLKRFAKVFEQTYTRFLDLQKAEAQAREAQIEAALERIRSKTIGMQSSDELREVVLVINEQLHRLDFGSNACNIIILDQASGDATYWVSGFTKDIYPVSYHVPYLDHPYYEALLEPWKRGDRYVVYEYSGQDKKDFEKISFAKTGFKDVPAEARKEMEDLPHVVLSTAYFANGALQVLGPEALSEEHASILQRFARVFDQTYTRFLDLKKAEAQAREAQIETALERVRSRSMGMQKSEDLTEVIRVIFEQMKLLDIHAEHAGIVVDYSPGQDWHFWVAENQDIPSRISVPYLDLPWDRQFVQAKENGTDLFTTLLNFEEKNDFYQKLLPHIPDLTEEMRDFYFTCPGLAASTVLQDDIGLYIENFSGTPYSEEDNNILRRFGKVFQQTYTRFLDLKRAEEQAREARIEAALEKVRSRTMAMQHSDELPEAANVLFLEVQALGIPAWSCGYNILAADKQSASCIMSSEGAIQKPFKLRLKGETSFEQFGEFAVGDSDFMVQELGGKALREHYDFMKSFPDMEPIFAEIEAAGLSLPTYQINHLCKFTHGFLLFITYEPVPDAHDVFKRFTAVFEQTYTRFLDLKRAEAQAREARIETALERVRARALAMQQPEELKDVAQVLRHEMGLLGVEELETSSIFINDREAGKAECWYAIKDIREREKVMVADHFALDLNETWVGREMLKFYQASADQVSIPMKGAQRKEWMAYCEAQSQPLKGYYGEVIPERTYHLYKFSHGAIGVATEGGLSEESWGLLRRAASAFSLAYSRFRDLTQARLDLQKLKEEKKRAEDALAELQLTQKQLVHAEKMASLGELTAGIAHEIQNPLNFVNNFSEVSGELLAEMNEELEKGDLEEARAIAEDLRQNLEKINHHGKRADGIVKGMLQHSRSGDGKKQPTNLNKLADEYLRLAYHGLRAKDKAFNATLETDFDKAVGEVHVVPQDIGRVLLNLLTNAFHAVSEKKQQAAVGFVPTVKVRTRKTPEGVEISVSDNGNGIPDAIKDKIFQPFFTTKPTGQGTGLGLSMSYDIVTKGHGGQLKLESKQEAGTEFIVILPV